MNTTANHTKRLIPMAAAMLLTMGLAGCADEGGLGGNTGGNTTDPGKRPRCTCDEVHVWIPGSITAFKRWNDPRSP